MLSLLLYLLALVAVAAIALTVFPFRPIRRAWAALVVAAALGGIAAVLLWPPPPVRAAAGKRLIDGALPSYQFAELHQTRICATPERIAAAVKQAPHRLVLESPLVLLSETPPELLLGSDPGATPRIVVNFLIERAAFGCHTVTTETRIDAGGPESRPRFAAYWRVIQPGSALLRRLWLDAIRRRAEAK